MGYDPRFCCEKTCSTAEVGGLISGHLHSATRSVHVETVSHLNDPVRSRATIAARAMRWRRLPWTVDHGSNRYFTHYKNCADAKTLSQSTCDSEDKARGSPRISCRHPRVIGLAELPCGGYAALDGALDGGGQVQIHYVNTIVGDFHESRHSMLMRHFVFVEYVVLYRMLPQSVNIRCTQLSR